jgi:hypothetical protein
MVNHGRSPRYFGQRIIAPPKTAAENRRLRFDQSSLRRQLSI